MAKPAADYHRGEMDIHEQKTTYLGFLAMSKWGSLALAVVLVWAVMCFCTKAGFLGSAAAAFILLVVGVLALRSKPQPGH
jgi:hypothetical protein